MNIQAEKIKLVQYVLNINSEKAIEKIKNFIVDQKQDDFWNELPDDVKIEVEEAIAQLKNGEGISHSKVMKKYEKWLKK
jgi:hypothetical protein